MKKKAIVIDFTADIHSDVIVGLAKRSLDIIYWTSKKKMDISEEDSDLFVDTVFHSTYDAVAGIPAEKVIFKDEQLVGAGVVSHMKQYESQTLAMMRKFTFNEIPLKKLQRMYNTYIHYWYNVLQHLKPDVVLFPDVPHIGYNYVLYQLAKMLQIKTVISKRTSPIPDRVLFYEDFTNLKELKAEIGRIAQEEHHTKNIDGTVLDFMKQVNNITSDKIPAQYKKFTGFSGKEKEVEFLPRLSSLKRNIVEHKFTKVVTGYVWMLLHKRDVCAIQRQKRSGLQAKIGNIENRAMCRRFRKEYRCLQVDKPDLSVPYIYVPLHRQPEGTTNPMGGIFDDQILMIDILRSCLPDGWNLYIKEHPTQWKFPLAHLGRFKGYYTYIASHGNVKLVPTNIPGFDLIDNCRGVATVTGTTGLEAVMKGKPALAFGYPIYMYCEGVLRVRDTKTCEEAMSRVYNGYTPNKEKVLQYLQAVERTAAKAYIHKRHGIHSGLTHNESVNNLIDGFFHACTF